MSSALNFTLKHLHSDVEQEKREKIPKEIEEDQQKTEDDMKGWCVNVKCIHKMLKYWTHPPCHFYSPSTPESATGAMSGRVRGRASVHPGL